MLERSPRAGHNPAAPLRPRWLARAALIVAVLIACCVGSMARADSGGDFWVIVDPDNRTTSVRRQFLAQAFLKNISRWDDGNPIRPVDQRADTSVRRRFSETVLERSVEAVKSYWQQRIFSGRGVPPPELESDEAVVRYVLQHPGALGYVSRATALGRTKIVIVN